jgi:hypothetical protein
MDASSLWWMVHLRPDGASRDGACVREPAPDDSARVLFPERFAVQTIMFVHSTHEIYVESGSAVKPCN